MKALAKCLLILTSLLLTPGLAGASLIDLSNSAGHVVYDDVAKKYWVWDLTAFNEQTYQQQIDTINNNYIDTSYYGLSIWHMASLSDMQAMWAYSNDEILSAFNHPVSTYIAGRYEEATTYLGAPAHFIGLLDSTFGKYSLSSNKTGDSETRTIAWVTADASSSVPEPSTMLLLGSGLAGLVGFGRRRMGKKAHNR